MLARALLLALLLAHPAAVLASGDGAPADIAPEHGKAATADASPVDPGTVEVEVGYAPSWNVRGGSRGFDPAEPGYTHGLAATVTYGAIRDLDVKLSAGFASIYDAAHEHDDGSTPKRGSGFTDATVGARWRFLDLPARALELAVTADLVVPVGARHTATQVGLTQDFWSARGALVATKDLGALTMNGELAVIAPVSGGAGGLRSVAQANAAVGYQLRAWLQPELELNYTHASSTGVDSEVLAITAGVVAPFGNHRVVAAVQQGLWGRNAAQTTTAVVAFKTAL